MSEKLKKIEFKRMLKRYESALEDLEYLQEMASEINSDFNSALAAKKRRDIFEDNSLKDMAKEESEEEKESPNRDPLFKKLFRKIVVKCHPDRMDPNLSIKQQAEYIDLYDQANKANDEDNMALLITVAIKLEIDLDEAYYEHIHKIEEESVKVKEQIEGIQGSVAWQWYHADDEVKDKMLDQYIEHMETILLKKNKIKKNILGIGHPRTGTGYTHTIMNSWGLKVGHEKMANDGIVAWQLVNKTGPWPFIDTVKLGDIYNFKNIIYNVRDPRTSIPSIIHSENTNEYSVNFRNDLFNIDIDKFENRVEAAIESLTQYDEAVSKMKPGFIFKIEKDSEALYNFLLSQGLKIEWDDSKVNKKYNARRHDGWKGLEQELDNVRPGYRAKINKYCEKYRYPLLFKFG